MSDRTVEQLGALADGAGVGYTQIAALLIEQALSQFEEGRAGTSSVTAQLAESIFQDNSSIGVLRAFEQLDEQGWRTLLADALDESVWNQRYSRILPTSRLESLDRIAYLVARLPKEKAGIAACIVVELEKQLIARRNRSYELDWLVSEPSDTLAQEVVDMTELRRDGASINTFPALGLATKSAKSIKVNTIPLGIWDCDLPRFFEGRFAKIHGFEFTHQARCHVPTEAQLKLCGLGEGAPAESDSSIFTALMFPRQALEEGSLKHTRAVAIGNLFNGYHLVCNKHLYQQPQSHKRSVISKNRSKNAFWLQLYPDQDKLDKLGAFQAIDPVGSLRALIFYMYVNSAKVIAYDKTAADYWQCVLKIVAEQFEEEYENYRGFVAKPLYDGLGATLIADIGINSDPKDVVEHVRQEELQFLICTAPWYAAAIKADSELEVCLSPNGVRHAIEKATIQEGKRDKHRKLFEASFIHTCLNVALTNSQSNSKYEQEFRDGTGEDLNRLCALVLSVVRHVSTPMGMKRFVKYTHTSEMNRAEDGDFFSLDEIEKAFKRCYVYQAPEDYGTAYYDSFSRNNYEESVKQHFSKELESDPKFKIDHSKELYKRFRDRKRHLEDMLVEFQAVIDSVSRDRDYWKKLNEHVAVLKDLEGVLKLAERMYAEDLHKFGSQLLTRVLDRLDGMRTGSSERNAAMIGEVGGVITGALVNQAK